MLFHTEEETEANLSSIIANVSVCGKILRGYEDF